MSIKYIIPWIILQRYIFNYLIVILTKGYLIENSYIKSGSKILYEDKLDEDLSLDQIRQKYFYTGNDNEHLKKFYDIRKGLLGNPNTQIKLVQTKFDYTDNGSMNYFFLTEATPDEKNKKELVDAPISDNPTGALKDNPSNTYTQVLKIRDFYDLLEELDMIDKEDFTTENLKAILELSQDVKLSCSCASFWWMGASFYLTQDSASLLPCNIAPKQWNKIRPEVKICKHITTLLKPQSISFLLPQMAQASKKVLQEEGFISKVKHSEDKLGRSHKKKE